MFYKYFKKDELLKQAFVNINRSACGGTIAIGYFVCLRLSRPHFNKIKQTPTSIKTLEWTQRSLKPV